MTIPQTHEVYRGLTLDPFQREALGHIDQNRSVLVSAPTGVGKTLVADYVIESMYLQGGRVIYTAPIKALSNQKFKEFKNHIGEDAVGILTGDVVVNREAPVLIMTTEIFRNLLQQEPERVADVRYVIFDEIHYIDDPQRGAVWEESLIFMPAGMRFLGLSATIPNVNQLAEWITAVQGIQVEVVTHFERIVPLKHHLYERSLGITNLKRVRRKAQSHQDRLASMPPWEREKIKATDHVDLIMDIKDDYLPCLFFTFSRRKCEANALQLGDVVDFLSPEQKEQAEAIIAAVEERYPKITSDRWHGLYRLLLKGIGYHHAGMLPALKDVVEELFTHRLVPVLYCTETFAVGLNFPCKTVCFDASTKWDGTSFRPLTNREYFQMAGRAGRRGIDEVGYAFTLVNLNYFDADEFPTMDETDIEPLQSQFALTYNSVLNLVNNYHEDDIIRILGQNFAAYQASEQRRRVIHELEKVEQALQQYCPHMDSDNCPIVLDRLRKKRKQLKAKGRKKANSRTRRRLRTQVAEIEERLHQAQPYQCTKEERQRCRGDIKHFRKLESRRQRLSERSEELDPQKRFVQEYQDKKGLLEALGYIEGDQLTTAGVFASQIHGQELLVTEIFMEGLIHEYSIPELNAVMVAIGYEPRKNEIRLKHRLPLGPVKRCVMQLRAMEEKFLGYSQVEFNDHLSLLVYRWTEGEAFSQLMDEVSIDEGDVVYGVRRGIDLLRQVRNAVREDPVLSAKLKDAIGRMDRDQVSIWL